jgi:transcriptional regulator with XRE-family HTH domain
MELTATDLRILLAERRVTQADVAFRLGKHPTQISHYLSGRREMPEGFTDQFRQAVEELATAEASHEAVPA